jgi:DNA-binding transcriptional regulator GbsR (MarR family)
MTRLTTTAKKFILHWGEMASRWGINRTVAQIHALLFISEQPLNAEQLTELLSVSRSNVSTSLRELQAWGIVKVVHVMGDRRDHFICEQDVWEMFQSILDERKRRVLDPAVEILHDCINAPPEGDDSEEYVRKRLQDMSNFLEMINNWYSHIRSLSPGDVRLLLDSSAQSKSAATAGANRQRR